MRRLIQNAIMFSLLAFPAIAEAAIVWVEPADRKVTYIYPASNGFIFGLDGATFTNNSCNQPNRVYIPLGAANYDAKVSTIITAFTSGRTLRVAIDDATITNCDTTVDRLIVAA